MRDILDCVRYDLALDVVEDRRLIALTEALSSGRPLTVPAPRTPDHADTKAELLVLTPLL